MAKLAVEIGEFALGVTLIVVGAFGNPALIFAGISFIVAGLTTVLTPGPITGLAASTRNPIKEWDIVYGQAKVGGTIVYMGSFGDSDTILDLVLILAAHPCESIDALCFDNQRVLIEPTTNCSFSPDNVSFPLASVVRVGDVVTCITTSPHGIESGDSMLMHDIGGDSSLNGKFVVEEIDSVTFRYVNGGAPVTVLSSGFAQQQFPDYKNLVYMEALLGGHSETFAGMRFGTTLGGDFVTNENNPWTNDCLNLGKTSVMLRIKYDPDVFAGGLPQISFRISGKNDVLDIRTGTRTYTRNATLCILDFLSNTVYGFKAKYGTEIPIAPNVSSANICDEAVTTAAGNAIPRYSCDGTFNTGMSRGTVLENLLSCCGGRLTNNSGQFVVHPAVWVAPDPGATLSLAQCSGPWEWKGPTLTNLFNGVRARYVSPAANWIEGDMPPFAMDSDHGYSNGPAEFQHDQNLADDGGDRRYMQVSYPFVINSNQCQRLAKIALLRSRFAGTGTFAFNLGMYKLAALDTVRFNLPFLNWTNKLLEISNHQFVIGKAESDVPSLGCSLELRETDPSIFEFDVSEELTPQGFRIGNALPTPNHFFNLHRGMRPAGAAQVFLDGSIFNYATMASGGSSTVLLDSNFDGLSGFGSATASFAGTIAASGTVAGVGTASFSLPVSSSVSAAGVGSGSMAAIILASVEGDGASTVALTGTRL